ncbi:protein CcmA, bactofilin family [Saccharicrinis carchari]|uniref:Protein CcmA, bactofilin family n=1 Tax=Saccharicrinis carchari TaxID=1168039 RepID=A0A521CMN8_SACCC|nr:polymer-forming cytoskeletal protein [Saccharicrinis carchari]SMO60712.1 protein CcmA, bactofilin family [Saccharicrinis carchari]
MAKSYEPETKSHNLIGVGTKITGNIETTESIRIDGEVEGNISSKGKVVVGGKGKIKGEIDCLNAEIEGVLEGKVQIKELLSLKSTSKLYGDIRTNKLTIEPGAVFTGKCAMGLDAKPGVPPVQDTKK